MKLNGISFIGADENTDVNQLFEMCANSKIPIEIGLLYSPNKAGKQKRYPSLNYIIEFVTKWSAAEIKYNNIDLLSTDQLSSKLRYASDNVNRPTLSLHLCGDGVRQFLKEKSEIINLSHFFERVQLNFSISEYDQDDLFDHIEHLASGNSFTGNIILQQNKSKKEFNKKFVNNNRIVFLFDGSGGFGRVLDAPEQPITGNYCGYAGGIGPDTVEDILIKIYKLKSDANFYIDMESKIREDNYFSIEKCQKVIEIASKLKEKYESNNDFQY